MLCPPQNQLHEAVPTFSPDCPAFDSSFAFGDSSLTVRPRAHGRGVVNHSISTHVLRTLFCNVHQTAHWAQLVP